MSGYIKRPAHVALEVPDLDASVMWATNVLGLRETERVDGVSYLTHADCHHSLQYIAADRTAVHHISLQARDHSALDGLHGRLRELEIKIISTEPEEPALDRAIRFRAPAGHVIEVFANMENAGAAQIGRGVPPRKLATRC
jgi:catechol 2,3-dioxygenase